MPAKYSFYIPRIASRYTEEQVYEVFRRFYIGDVRRVDFVEIPGETKFQSAFVHMDYVIDTHATNVIIDRVFTQNRRYKIYPDYVNQNAYWALLKNNKPVTETRLNVHQIAENANLLRETVRIQGERIERLQQTLYQVMGEVFDHNKEEEMERLNVLSDYMWNSK